MSADHLLRSIRSRLANMLGRAIVRLVEDGGGLQVVQLDALDGETRSGCERVQAYGFTSHPHAGAEAAVLFVGGRRDHALVIAVDDRRYRMKGLAPGEAALYTDEGDYVLLKRGRIVEVKAGTKLRVDAPLSEITGDVTIAGTLEVGGTVQAGGLVTALASVAVTGNVAASGAISDAGGSMASMRGTYNEHTHPENGDGGGTTSPPNQEM